MNKRRLPRSDDGSLIKRALDAIVVLCVLVLALISPVAAAELKGESSTYIQSREGGDGTKYLPLYEYLNFSVQNAGTENVSFHFGGWLGYDMGENSFQNDTKNTGSDLHYGYLSYRVKDHNAVVNMGRVMVFEGVAAERLDGIYARTDIKGGFGIAAYGGVPVETGDNLPGNNTIFGGRVTHQKPGLYTVGLSYLKEEKNSNTFREEEGVDLWLRPISKVELMGRSVYNIEASGWMEHAYYLILGPFDKLRFNTEFSFIDYGSYFAGTTTNVFKLTPGGLLDPKETVNILGEEVFYTINKNWTVSVDYRSYSYDIAGSAAYYGAKATYAVPKAYSAGLSMHKMDGDTKRLQYDEYRIYASKKIDKIDVAVDLIDVKYKEPINNVSNAYAVTVAAGYELLHNLKAGLDIEYAKNPDYDKDVRVFAKVVWSFDAGSGAKASAGQKAAPATEAKPAASTQLAAVQTDGGPGKPKEGN